MRPHPEGGALIFAQLNAMIDGFGGSFIEAHRLDADLAKKIPKLMIGRTLTFDEAAALLDRLPAIGDGLAALSLPLV